MGTTKRPMTGEELACRLAWQLERLASMRNAAAKLMARDQKGKDFFSRGETSTELNFRGPVDDLQTTYQRVIRRKRVSKSEHLPKQTFHKLAQGELPLLEQKNKPGTYVPGCTFPQPKNFSRNYIV